LLITSIPISYKAVNSAVIVYCTFAIVSAETLFRISGRPEAADIVAGSLEVDTLKAVRTGWRPQLSLDEGQRSRWKQR
jgi:hypothetical protein